MVIMPVKSGCEVFVFEDKDTEDGTVSSFDDTITVKPLYMVGIVDNILFLNGVGEEYKAQFYDKTRSAWLEYWTQHAKGARIKRKRW